MLVGGLPAALEMLLYERWCVHAFYGIYGDKEMKIVRKHWRSLTLFSSIHCILDIVASSLMLSYHDFLSFFLLLLLVMYFLLYTSCMPRGA